MKKNEKKGGKHKYDKNRLNWVEGKGWEGVVYSYTLQSSDNKNGWKYIGCTPEETARRNAWNCEKYKYGTKINDARKKYGINSFTYVVLETLYDEDIEKLVERLEERETYYIQKFDSYSNGFNGNKGGKGRSKGFKHSKETKDKIKAAKQANGKKVKAYQTDEIIRTFNTMLDAAKYYDINTGSVFYSCEHAGAKVGKAANVSFERIA